MSPGESLGEGKVSEWIDHVGEWIGEMQSITQGLSVGHKMKAYSGDWKHLLFGNRMNGVQFLMRAHSYASLTVTVLGGGGGGLDIFGDCAATTWNFELSFHDFFPSSLTHILIPFSSKSDIPVRCYITISMRMSSKICYNLCKFMQINLCIFKYHKNNVTSWIWDEGNIYSIHFQYSSQVYRQICRVFCKMHKISILHN